MRIGIDIDDVIAETSLSMRDYIEKYDTTGDVSKYLVEIMRGEIPTQPVKEFLDTYCLSVYQNAKVKDHASEVLTRLINAGNELYMITSRGEQKYKGSENFTLEYFKTNNIPVDDSTKHCMEIRQEGIHSILFTSDVNKKMDVPITRVNNWLALEEKLQEIKQEKN